MNKQKIQLSLYILLSILVAVFVYFTFKPDKAVILVAEDEALVYKFGFLNLHDSVEYVGIEACKECHMDMWQAYMRTGMGQSWDLATKSKSASVFEAGHPLYDAKSAYYYQPYWQQGMMMVQEYKLDGEDTVYQRTEMVDYIVGSGQHTNSHIRSVNGYLFQVPFTFYTQISLLDFPPGFENGNNARFSRIIGHECITCHNSYPNPYKNSVNKYKEVPHGINCERCHGPGELHVEAMKAGNSVNTDLQPDYTIINPKRLSTALQFELCARCHTQGNAVLKQGRDFYSFKPSMYLSDVMDVYREKYENDADAFWMETHPERLSKSKCYIATRNHPDFDPLTCTDCHFTPSMRHISYKETPVDTFRSQCLRCHAGEKAVSCTEKITARSEQGDNCIHCHMVKTGVFDIPHVRISDHFIRVTDKWKKPIKSTSEIETGKFLGLKCMNNDKPEDISKARAYLYHYEKFTSDPALLDSALFYLQKVNKTKEIEWWIYYYFLRKDYKSILALKNTYLENRSITSPVMNYQIGQSYHYVNQYEMAVKYFQIAVEQQYYNLDYHNKLGTELMLLKEYSEAVKEFEFIIEENPEIASAHNNLGFVYLITGDMTEAEKKFNAALRLDPDYITAHLNLLKVYISRSEKTRARLYANTLRHKFPVGKEIDELMSMLE
jgi:hypothetical protein